MLDSKASFSLDFNKRKITDKRQIAKYDKEFNYEFYRPKSEHEWIDTNLVLSHSYTNSRKRLGTTLEPIYVAVNDNDENYNDPAERVHGRIVNGTQRYEDSKIVGERWPVIYIYVRDYEDYILLWCSMDSKKSGEVRKQQTSDIISRYCQIVLKKKPEEICDADGQPNNRKVGRYVCQQLKFDYNERTLYRYIPKEFKDEIKSSNRTSNPESKEKKLSKKDKHIIELQNHVTELLTQQTLNDINSKPKDVKTKMIIERDNTIKKLKIVVGETKTIIKQLRIKYGLDRNDEEFEQFWARFSQQNGMYEP